MGVPLSPEVKAQIEALLNTLRPLNFVIDGNIANVSAAASVPMMVPGVPAPILLPPSFVNSLTAALRSQRDYNEKLFNLVELMYQKIAE